jgi:hypothetical protein
MTLTLLASDYFEWLMALWIVLGMMLFFALWVLYLNVCRYRTIVHGRFFRDEHSWLQQ